MEGGGESGGGGNLEEKKLHPCIPECLRLRLPNALLLGLQGHLDQGGCTAPNLCVVRRKVVLYLGILVLVLNIRLG